MPEVQASSPFRPKIRDILSHFLWALLQLESISSQSSSDAVKTLLSYLKDNNASSVHPYARNASAIPVWASSSIHCKRFFWFLGAHRFGWVSALQVFTRNKNVAAGALWLGEFSLFQGHYSWPHVSVQEVDPEGGPIWGPTWVVHHGACHFYFRPREINPICPGLHQGGGPSPPLPPDAKLGRGSPATLLLSIQFSRYRRLDGTVFPYASDFTLSYVVHRLLQSGPQWSCSSPIWDNVPSGHQRYVLLGLNLGYMYWGQKHSSE